MNREEIIDWLMAGDPAIAFLAARDLLGLDRPDLRARIANKGWGKAFLTARNAHGEWGRGYYVPKWACTHYVLLDLANMEFPPDHPEIAPMVARIVKRQIAGDGGFAHAPGAAKSDVCVTAMYLTIAAHFHVPEPLLTGFIDWLISTRMADGGFNCQINRSGCVRSSLHSTTSVLEMIQRLADNGYRHRSDKLAAIAKAARAFILRRHFFRSERTGEVISPKFLALPYPPRWYYNILRGLDQFRAAGAPHDPRMDEALDRLEARRRDDGRWPRMAKIAGETLFEMEPARGPGRWNTLLALRVLDAYPRA